jgi:LysM repeat protein
MAQMIPIPQGKLWILVVLCSLAGCTQPLPATTLQPTDTLQTLIPYQTPTGTRLSPTLTPVDSIPITPAPSATPFTHMVVRGETMLGIALRYGVTLEALQASNPGVDPQFLSVDTALIIPLGNEIQVMAATPTPVMIDWIDPVCYRTGDGGAWCFLLVENNLVAAVENISAWIGLFGSEGEVIASQVAVGPINILRPGQAMPLLAFFHPPLPTEIIARGELMTAIGIQEDDGRYLDWQVAELAVAIRGETNQEAWVTGRIDQPGGSSSPGLVWITAVAYDLAGQVVGVRKYETNGELAFDLTVYSLRGAIDRVEILTEIRP